eukprot:CAMPEP_0198229088 /NCGR_PEP_ID=MMETSP1445-20131203/113942_1 /TAXON_ID=36898 /ORGANISM="Pyramimonas sp., Strain CCMP2087" /LENGTH=80 /DNA_ID=CAMNT_0043909531 /DNA_START=24 /DNA_END=266 /DNA_ORIENTATION=+
MAAMMKVRWRALHDIDVYLKTPKVEFFRKGLAGCREKLGSLLTGRGYPRVDSSCNSVYTLTEKPGCNLLYGVMRVGFFVG